jgi:tetratricopeptide (TPR) repeat protein
MATIAEALNIAVEHHRGGRLAQAEQIYRQVLQVDRSNFDALHLLGVIADHQGNYEMAVQCITQAIRLHGSYAPFHANLGEAYRKWGKTTEALAAFRRALQLDPELVEAHANQSLPLLLMGDFAAGWREYEWRWKLAEFTPPPWPQPAWDGSPLAGRTILLYAEQGLGDALQFVRYGPLVQARGGTVIVMCTQRLIPILSTCAGVDRFVACEGQVPPFDVHASLLSLPGIFRSDLTTIPADVPYLSVANELVEAWRGVLASDGQFRVGIFWQGNPGYRGDCHRSFRLSEFAPLAGVAGVRLVSLQKGPGLEQLANVPFAVENLGSRLDEQGAAFWETAAVMKNLDLVVTSDTAIAHLAGALGVRVWLALSFAGDWRWLQGRSDSPWYPTMRLFRQSKFGDWPGVFERMAVELSAIVDGSSPT